MRTYLVEVSPPFFDQNLRLGARTKPFEAQTLVADSRAATFVLPAIPSLFHVPSMRITIRFMETSQSQPATNEVRYRNRP